MLSVYVRHLLNPDGTTVCGKDDIHDRRCRCPKWIRGTLPGSGTPIRKSSGAFSWEQAEQIARKWEQEALDPTSKRRRISDVCSVFIANKEGQRLSNHWTRRMRILANDLEKFATSQGLLFLDQITTAELIAYRSTWKVASLTAQKRQEQLSAFFKFCIDQGWMVSNPVRSMGRINVRQTPTDYFTPEEYQRLLEVTYREDFWTTFPYQRVRLRALIELLRYSGLRITDAITLQRDRVSEDGKLFLYTQKTGVPVYVPLPPHVNQQLKDLKNRYNPNYFFWSGDSKRENAQEAMYVGLKLVFKRAELDKHCHPHMFRDTFAIELLLAGVPIDHVSLLLGHKSIKTTERHYAPFVKARQEQIANSAMKAWPKAELKLVGKRA